MSTRPSSESNLAAIRRPGRVDIVSGVVTDISRTGAIRIHRKDFSVTVSVCIEDDTGRLAGWRGSVSIVVHTYQGYH